MRIHRIPRHPVTSRSQSGAASRRSVVATPRSGVGGQCRYGRIGGRSTYGTIPRLLERVPLFSTVHPFRLQHITEAAIIVSASRGKIILKTGDTYEGLFVVVYGRVAVALRSDTGAQKVIEILGAGQTIGLAGLFSPVGSRTEARALSDSKLLLIPRELVYAEPADNPAFARELARLYQCQCSPPAHRSRSLHDADGNAASGVFSSALDQQRADAP